MRTLSHPCPNTRSAAALDRSLYSCPTFARNSNHSHHHLQPAKTTRSHVLTILIDSVQPVPEGFIVLSADPSSAQGPHCSARSPSPAFLHDFRFSHIIAGAYRAVVMHRFYFADSVPCEVDLNRITRLLLAGARSRTVLCRSGNVAHALGHLSCREIPLPMVGATLISVPIKM